METFDLAELLSKRGESLREETKPLAPLSPEASQPEFPSIIESNLNSTNPEGQVVDTNGTGTTQPRPFFGQEKGNPQYVLQQEKAHHRVILYELAMGKKAGEIAKEFGFTPAMVYYVEKQPWAKEAVKNLIHQHGGDQVEQRLKGAALDAAEVLVRMKDDKDAPHAVRVNAAKEILDRIYGRSQQIINHRKVDACDISDEELAKLATTRTGSQ